MTTDVVQKGRNRRRVRVWFGRYLIAEFVGDEAHATRYEDAMRRRFAGLSITSSTLPPLPTAEVSR